MRVIISGAGIAGPTFAWFLAKTGAHIDIVEKSPSLLPHGQNVDFKGSAIKVIEKMGLMDQIRQLNTTEKGTQFVDSTGRPFASFPINDGRSPSLTSEFEILRADLAKILHHATKDHPNITYHFNTTITRVLSNTPDSVSVSLSTTPTPTPQTYDLLVLADGQWSPIRTQLFPATSIHTHNFNMHTAYWTIPRHRTDPPKWSIHLSPPARTLSLRPDPHNTTRAMATLMPLSPTQHTAWATASRSPRAQQIALLRAEFASSTWAETPRLLAALDHAPDLYLHPMQQIRMASWSANRVVCVGDAAHAPSPVAGGGTSLALLGAYVLAGELGEVDQSGGEEGVGAALERYERALRPHVEAAQRVPGWAPAVAHPRTEWGRWGVEVGVWAAAKVVAGLGAVGWRGGGGTREDDFAMPVYAGLEEGEEEGG